jgi:hypothetical protein
MSAKEMRERIDSALAGLQGDVVPVRRLAFELADQLKRTKADLAEATRALEELKLSHARLTDRADVLKIAAESWRTRTNRQAGQMAALEGQVAALTAEPRISKKLAVRALGFLVEAKLNDPKEVKARLAKMDGDKRQAIAYALALTEADPAWQELAALSEDQIALLFHFGFSELHFLRTICGDKATSEYVLE